MFFGLILEHKNRIIIPVKKEVPEGEKIYRKFLEIAKRWLKDLDHYGEHQFRKKPDENSWSVGQLYDHLIHGTYNFHLQEIRNCLEKRNGAESGKKKFKGQILFTLGSFPPVKIKGIGGNNEPAQPEKPELVKDEFFRFIKVMQKVAQELDQHKDNSYKTMHPTLGMLSGMEWYQLIEMHFRHHLRQKKVLDEAVKSFYKEEEGVDEF